MLDSDCFLDIPGQALRKERASWRAIIQLNIIQSFHLMMDAMTRAQRHDGDEQTAKDLPTLTTDHLKIKQRLLPLLEIEKTLICRLCPVASFPSHRHLIREVAVNSASSWKNCFQKFMKTDGDSISSKEMIDWDDPEDPGMVLNACSEDMIRLWTDPVIQTLLNKLKVKIREQTGLWELLFYGWYLTDHHTQFPRCFESGYTAPLSPNWW